MAFPHLRRSASLFVSSLAGRVLLGMACLLTARLSVCQATAGEFNGSLDAPEAEVLRAVQRVATDPVVYGTYSYEKEKQLKGAQPAQSLTIFGDAPDAGKQFFKIAENVLAPRHFKETADLGSVYVRYIVQGTGPATTAIRINAVYVEKTRRRQHASDGTVEESEFQAIRERLEKIQAEATPPAKPTAEQSEAASRNLAASNAPDKETSIVSSTDDLERRVADLRSRVELRTAAGGAALKAAPYRTAATLQPLPPQSELLVVVLTRYWYGVETTDGHRGWVHRSQVEPLP